MSADTRKKAKKATTVVTDPFKAAGAAAGSVIGGAVAGPVGGVYGTYEGYKAGEEISNALSASPAMPAAPTRAPTVMPVRGDAADKAARRKSIAAQKARRGRASTILTNSESLG